MIRSCILFLRLLEAPRPPSTIWRRREAAGDGRASGTLDGKLIVANGPQWVEHHRGLLEAQWPVAYLVVEKCYLEYLSAWRRFLSGSVLLRHTSVVPYCGVVADERDTSHPKERHRKQHRGCRYQDPLQGRVLSGKPVVNSAKELPELKSRWS